MIVTVEHIRAANVCVDGLKIFCKQHDIDFRSLINDGIEAEILEKIDDVTVKKVLEVAYGWQ